MNTRLKSLRIAQLKNQPNEAVRLSLKAQSGNIDYYHKLKSSVKLIQKELKSRPSLNSISPLEVQAKGNKSRRVMIKRPKGSCKILKNDDHSKYGAVTNLIKDCSKNINAIKFGMSPYEDQNKSIFAISYPKELNDLQSR